ncbi:MAG: electron transfer flavoprotein subunit beta [Clostridiales bacterium]|nr:electron transfer flavoprotein subunit beta [Clostridiales bacterium]
MNILVCIKQVPDTNKVEVDPITGVLKRNGVESKMNPYDLYAIETALRIREETGGTICAVTMGPGQAAAVIREIKKLGDFDLILCGKQTTDGDTAQVGPEVSEWLNIPCVSNVSKIVEIQDGAIIIEMDMTNDIEISKVQFPCLLTVDKDIFMPRLPSYVKKQETKDREITIITLNDLDDKDEKNYGLNGSPTQVQRIFPPEVNAHQEIWNGTAVELSNQLLNKLQELKFA